MITLKELNFSYQSQESLFSNLELKLEAGGICGLLGKNGAGKTSMLKLLAGLLFPQSGTCQVFESEPGNRQPKVLADICYIGEEFYLPAITITSYEKLYAQFYPRFDHEQFKQHIKEFGLNQDKILTELSYGQKKKFLISFGLATQCRLLLLDEPTNGFDIPSKSQFRQLIAKHVSDDRLFIISTHQVHDVENLIDSIVVLDQGKIAFNTTMAELSEKLKFSHENIEPAVDECIYFEKRLGGYTVLTVNKTGDESHVDLEVLFNALLANQDQLQKVFKRSAS